MSLHNLFEQEARSKTILMVSLILVVVTVAVYGQVAGNDFVNMDDYDYVLMNPYVSNGFTRNGIVWAFTSSAAANWHPLTWLSHMADVQFFGMNPHAHHVTNLVIHLAASVLLLVLFCRLTRSLFPSVLVAALFALHPLHVESVAWISERKDVLSAFFCFLTLLCYVEYAAKRKAWLYLAALLAYLCGLMSKPMLVTLPVLLLLLDYWPLTRFAEGNCQPGLAGRTMALLKEKIPFFVLSILCCLITFYVQEKGGATKSFGEVSPLLRVEDALVGYLRYLGKTLWPQDLAAMYPLPAFIPLWQAAGAAAALLAVTVAAIAWRKRYPYLLMGWLWFLCTLLPVIGLIQVGEQAIADRYTYIPGIGLSVMLAWGVMDATRKLRNRETVLTAFAAAVIVVCAFLSWRQVGYWHDPVKLFQHANQVTPDSYVIHKYLGDALADTDNIDAAVAEYREALRLNPRYAEVHNLLGLILASKGDLDAALGEYRQALQSNPRLAAAHRNLAAALAGKGRLDEAVQEYRLYLRLSPADPRGHLGLALALEDRGELEAAIGEIGAALEINPYLPEAHNSLGVALAKSGNAKGAIRQFQEALRLAPDFAEARSNLAIAQQGTQPTR